MSKVTLEFENAEQVDGQNPRSNLNDRADQDRHVMVGQILWQGSNVGQLLLGCTDRAEVVLLIPE